MKHQFKKLVHADLPSLSGCMQEAEQFLTACKAPQEVVFAANLALEELITNTIKYGYGSEPPRAIDVSLVLGDKILFLEVVDDSNPFDPFSQPDPDFSLPPEKRPIGGLGIHLVRNMMTSCKYRYSEGQNIVTLTKTWEEDASD